MSSKEKYSKFRDEYKKMRNSLLWLFVFMSVFSAIVVVLGAWEHCIMWALPTVGLLYYLIRFNKKIKEYNALIEKADEE